MDKAICAITLSTAKPMQVEAVWHKGNLSLLSEKTLPTERKALMQTLPATISKMESDDYEVLVDERSGFFSSTGGTHIQLANPGPSGKPILVEALDLYREMSQQKAIIRPNTSGGTAFRTTYSILTMTLAARPFIELTGRTSKASTF